MDIPIPILTHGEFAVPAERVLGESAKRDGEEEIDISSYRPMDLCAWQAGRAIQAGRPTFGGEGRAGDKVGVIVRYELDALNG
jgi:hypothetical protein